MYSPTENAATYDVQDSYAIGEDLGSQNHPQKEYLKPEEETWFVEIASLDDVKYQIQKPIIAQITYENKEYRAEVPETETYAFDKSVEDVLIEIVAELVQLCDEILELPDEKLGKAPQQWKQFLLDHIKIISK